MRHEDVTSSPSQRRRGICQVSVTERFTLRQTLPDGSIIRSDGDNFWWHRGVSWYGLPPVGWDPAQAVEEEKVFTYEQEVDYS